MNPIMNKLGLVLLAAIVASCSPHLKDPNPSNEDEKSEIIRTMTKSYVDGKLNGDHVAEECNITFNNQRLTKEEWSQIAEFHQKSFEKIEFTNGWIQTTAYEGENWGWGDGTTWSHQWNSWTATSKISGETHTNACHWGFLWKDGKIVRLAGFFSDEWYNKEVALYMKSIGQ
tara:strand:+ start:123 stop:638 length:516 start_codon:yes stop_codon:yes gene_type:complete